MSEPSTEGLLTDFQLEEIIRVCAGLNKIQEAIDRLNALVAASGLTLRAVPSFTLGQMGNDVSRLLFAHELAEKRIAAAAFEAVERMAA